MRKALCTGLLALAALMTAVAAYGQAEDGELEDDVNPELSLSAAERSELIARINREPSAGMSRSQLWDFYRDQDFAAQRLGDAARELELLPKWLAAAGSDLQLQLPPLWRLWRANMMGGDVSVGLKYGNDLVHVVSASTNSLYHIRTLAALARDYIDLMALSRGEELLKQAQAELSSDSSRKYRPLRHFKQLRAEIFILSARRSLLSHQGKHADAEIAARQEVDAAVKAQAIGRELLGERMADSSARLYIMAVEDVMQTQTGQGHLIDAAVTAQTLLRFFQANQIAGGNLNGAYLRISELKLAQNDLRRAEFYARAALKNAQAGNANVFSKPAIAAHHRLLDVLIVRRAWTDALALQDRLDVAVAGNDFATRFARRVLPRGLILTYSGRIQEAQALLKRSAEYHVAQYGTHHIDTVLAHGLYAIALAKGGQKEVAHSMFAVAVRDLLAPDIVGGDVSAQGLHRAFRQLILEEYIALLSERPADPAAIDAAFRAAEYLRGSVVQQSVVDSAVRAAAGVAGLGDLVRVEQDAKNEITVLQTFLMRQLAEPPQRQLPNVVEQMQERIKRLQADITVQYSTITRRFPEYDALTHPQPPSVAAVTKRIGPDETFISILPMSSQVAIFAVSAQGASLAMAPLSAAQLDALVKRLRATLDIGDLPPETTPAFDADAAYQLYDALLAPARPVWQGKPRLVIAAGGSLGQIPFGTLLTAPMARGMQVNDAVMSKAAWLVNQASISHVPSVSSWVALRDAANVVKSATVVRKPFFGFGDPLFSSAQAAVAGTVRKVANSRPGDAADLVSATQYDRLPPLPETRDEIMAIAGALGADPNRDALFGKEASRKNVMSADLRSRQVIAFATHGLVAGDLPNLSQPALALAATGNDNDSPLLTLEDVLNLKLDADWVVLSACNTAAADGQAGEAISGLGRGFFYAGAKALLVTHWAVESQSAMELTTATFRRFGSDSAIPRAEALRQAQIALIAGKRYAHPFFWAPYALIGDGGR